MSSKKVIQIKPELFKMQKTKTIKNNKKITAPIDTSKIKEQLTANILKRRKQKLKTDMEMEKRRENSEFDKSFNFMLEEREKEREIKEKNLKKSIKHKNPELGVLVNVEWPSENNNQMWTDKELEEVPLSNMSDSMLSYKLDKEIQYGCLKGGLKKTFKNLSGGGGGSAGHSTHNKTASASRVKFSPNIVDNSPTPITPPHPIVVSAIPPPLTVVQPQQMQPMTTTELYLPPSPSLPQPQITIPNTPSINNSFDPGIMKTVQVQEPFTEPEYVPPQITLETIPSMVPVEITPTSTPIVGGGEQVDTSSIKVPSIKETVKRKTIKHKYKLGKSKTLNNRISILSTSKSRIKAIQDAKKELQKTTLEKMKKYLMDKNLLSAGSFAPPDVIKKMYEEANITADITNHNDDKLLENYLDKH